MDSHTTGILIVTVSVLVPCAAGLTAYWMRLKSQQRLHGPEVEQLNADLEAMRADHQQQLDDLHERLDFAERMLAEKREPKHLDSGK